MKTQWFNDSSTGPSSRRLEVVPVPQSRANVRTHDHSHCDGHDRHDGRSREAINRTPRAPSKRSLARSDFNDWKLLSRYITCIDAADIFLMCSHHSVNGKGVYIYIYAYIYIYNICIYIYRYISPEYDLLQRVTVTSSLCIAQWPSAEVRGLQPEAG